MVWDPPQQHVIVNRMIIYSLIPLLSIYAAWRIQKFWLLVIISVALGIAITIPSELLIPYPFGWIVSIIVDILFAVIIVKHYAVKYNEKIGDF